MDLPFLRDGLNAVNDQIGKSQIELTHIDLYRW